MPEIEAGILPANRPHPLELACFLIASNGDGGTMQRTVGCASFARPPAASLLLASTAMSKSHTTVTNVLCAAPTSAPNGRTAVRYFKYSIGDPFFYSNRMRRQLIMRLTTFSLSATPWGLGHK